MFGHDYDVGQPGWLMTRSILNDQLQSPQPSCWLGFAPQFLPKNPKPPLQSHQTQGVSPFLKKNIIPFLDRIETRVVGDTLPIYFPKTLGISQISSQQLYAPNLGGWKKIEPCSPKWWFCMVMTPMV